MTAVRFARLTALVRSCTHQPLYTKLYGIRSLDYL